MIDALTKSFGLMLRKPGILLPAFAVNFLSALVLLFLSTGLADSLYDLFVEGGLPGVSGDVADDGVELCEGNLHGACNTGLSTGSWRQYHAQSPRRRPRRAGQITISG